MDKDLKPTPKVAHLFYVIGPSGAGKDSVMSLIRAQWPQLMIAHRYITRLADAGGENHVALTEIEFKQRKESQLFALDWQANGYCYGIGCEVDAWLSKGVDVMINGSRAYLHQAQQRYGDLLVPVVIEVPIDILRQRLTARGRETVAQIELRLLRAKQFSENRVLGAIELDNGGGLQSTIAPFNDYYQRYLERVELHDCSASLSVKQA